MFRDAKVLLLCQRPAYEQRIQGLLNGRELGRRLRGTFWKVTQCDSRLGIYAVATARIIDLYERSFGVGDNRQNGGLSLAERTNLRRHSAFLGSTRPQIVLLLSAR